MPCCACTSDPLVHAAARQRRQLVLAPCYAIGACSDHVTLRFELFDYVERDVPLLGFRAALASRRSSMGRLPPPPVRAASVHIRLKMSESLLGAAVLTLHRWYVNFIMVITYHEK